MCSFASDQDNGRELTTTKSCLILTFEWEYLNHFFLIFCEFCSFFLALLQITVAFYTTSKNLLQLLNQVITGLHFGGKECMRKGAKKFQQVLVILIQNNITECRYKYMHTVFALFAAMLQKHSKFCPNPAATIARFYSISRDPNICLHSSTCRRTDIKGRFSLYQRCENYFPKLQSDTVFRSCQGRFTVHWDHCLAVVGYLNWCFV